MSRICPNCKYPNLDRAETCFKCGADITDNALRVAREQEIYNQNQQRQRERDRVEFRNNARRMANNNGRAYVENDATDTRLQLQSIKNLLKIAYWCNIILGTILICGMGMFLGLNSINNGQEGEGYFIIFITFLIEMLYIPFCYIIFLIPNTTYTWMICMSDTLNKIKENTSND